MRIGQDNRALRRQRLHTGPLRHRSISDFEKLPDMCQRGRVFAQLLSEQSRD